MTNQRKTAVQYNFTESTKRVKLEFIRLAAWLSIAKGV